MRYSPFTLANTVGCSCPTSKKLSASLSISLHSWRVFFGASFTSYGLKYISLYSVPAVVPAAALALLFIMSKMLNAAIFLLPRFLYFLFFLALSHYSVAHFAASPMFAVIILRTRAACKFPAPVPASRTAISSAMPVHAIFFFMCHT